MVFNITDSIKALHQWTENHQDTLLRIEHRANEEKITTIQRDNLEYFLLDSSLNLASIISAIRNHINIKKELKNETLTLLETKIKSYNSSLIRSLFGFTILPLQTNTDEIEFIINSVKNHLKPYQEGKITRATDKKNRPSFASLITKQFYLQFPASSRLPTALIKKAFEEYLFEGIRGYQRIIGKKISYVNRYDPYIAQLVITFGNAFQKDFPKFKDIPGDLFKLVQTGLRIVNSTTTISYQELERLRLEQILQKIIQTYPKLTNSPLTEKSPLEIATATFADIVKDFKDYENRPKNIEELTHLLKAIAQNVQK